jgi:hypothetical protein
MYNVFYACSSGTPYHLSGCLFLAEPPARFLEPKWFRRSSAGVSTCDAGAELSLDYTVAIGGYRANTRPGNDSLPTLTIILPAAVTLPTGDGV